MGRGVAEPAPLQTPLREAKEWASRILVDTGATYSVSNKRKEKCSRKSVDVVGATGQKEN